MKKLLLILLCLPMIGFGQGWTQIYPYNCCLEDGKDVQQTSDGGYITCGDYNGPNGNEIRLIKTDASGNLVWNQIFGSTNPDWKMIKSINQTNDGGYIIFSTQQDTNWNASSKTLLIKTDASGSLQWYQTYNDIYLDDGGKTSDGGYVFIGNGAPLILTKVDLGGNQQWTQSYSNFQFCCQPNVEQTTDGGYIISGGDDLSSGNITLIKTDLNGILEWSQVLPGEAEKEGKTRQTNDGGYISCASIDFGSFSDIILIKTDNNGNQISSQNYGLSNRGEESIDIQQTADNGYIICGEWQGLGDTAGINLIKVDNNFNQQWTYDFPNFVIEARAIQQTIDGGYIISGTCLNSSGDTSPCLLKTDSQGNTTSTFNIPINPNRKLEKVVDILGKQTKPQTNIPFIEIYDDGTVEKRIVIE
tara:strand:+ start:451 stop:1698 length:1248 start_codon:yes stop_codon:yes gene_type:complete